MKNPRPSSPCKRATLLVLFLCPLLFSSCGYSPQNPAAQSALTGGAVGGLIGAGTGALIGSSLKNGNVGKSALIGAAVGIPVGAAIGAGYRAYERDQAVKQNDAQISSNREQLTETQRDIERLRQDMEEDTSAVQPNVSRREQIYDGQTLGNPFR